MVNHGLTPDGKIVYITQKYAKNGSLLEFLINRAQEPLDEPSIQLVMSKVLSGLKYIHE